MVLHVASHHLSRHAPEQLTYPGPGPLLCIQSHHVALHMVWNDVWPLSGLPWSALLPLRPRQVGVPPGWEPSDPKVIRNSADGDADGQHMKNQAHFIPGEDTNMCMVP